MLDSLRLALQRRLETLTSRNAPAPTAVVDSKEVESLRAQGNAFIASGKLNEAENCFRQALTQKPDDTRLLVCLGYALKEQSLLTAARIVLKRATNTNNGAPEVFEAHYLLGEISEEQADLEDAKKHFSAALELKPDFTRACDSLVRILELQGHASAIRPLLEERVRLCPDIADYRLWLAERCADVFDFQGVAEHLMAAVALGINEVPIHVTIGSALCRLGRADEAQNYFEMAQAADPSVAYECQYHLGYYHWKTGNTKASIAFVEKSIELQPGYMPSHSLLLMNLSLGDSDGSRSYQEAALRLARTIQLSTPPALATPPFAEAKVSPVVRVGFLAGEFRIHPVYHFLIGVMQHIDRTQFQWVAFSNNPTDDAGTQTFKTLFDEWHDIRKLTDDEAANLVRASHIDVLIDLSGHTGDGSLPVFARKPAPVQASWLGYWASTGLDEMDYIIADPVCVPEDSTQWFSEKVVRLPSTRLCIATPQTSRTIEVMPPPCKTRGFVTFGSFQQSTKINTQVMRVWARVMALVPQSRLRIQTQAIHSKLMRDKIHSDLAHAGMDMTRVELLGAVGWEEYLEAHREVDILLDTFPFPGGTTTAFALWMGVPTISLAGNTMLSRQGASMLQSVGLSEWVVNNEDEYVDAARRLSSNVDGLAELRNRLRADTIKSPLFDTRGFAKDLQNALLWMYQDKLAQSRYTSQPSTAAALPSEGAGVALGQPDGV